MHTPKNTVGTTATAQALNGLTPNSNSPTPLRSKIQTVHKTKRTCPTLSSLPSGYCGPCNGDGEDLYVEKLLDVSTTKKGVRTFFIKWMGYPTWENTWEPEEILTKEIVKQFDDRVKDNLQLKSSKQYSRDSEKSKASKRKNKKDVFPKNWVAEEIKGFQSGTERKRVLVKFKDHSELFPASYEYCKRRIPHLVIQFFQAHLQQ